MHGSKISAPAQPREATANGAVSYTCETNAEELEVVSFACQSGAEVPRREWEVHFLVRSEDALRFILMWAALP